MEKEQSQSSKNVLQKIKLFSKQQKLKQLLNKKSKEKPYFALDIGSGTIKFLQLTQIIESAGVNKQITWKIERVGHAFIDKSVISDKNITNSEKISNIIKSTLKRHKIKTNHVFSSLPSDQATSKVITIPNNMTILEEEDFVQLEAGNVLPFPIEEVRYDYEIFDKDTDNITNIDNPHQSQSNKYSKLRNKYNHTEDKTSEKNIPQTKDIRLVAAKIDQYQNRVDALMEAGLKVDVMDVDEFAICRALNFLIGKFPLKSKTKTTNKKIPYTQAYNTNINQRNSNQSIEVLFDIGHDFSFIYVVKNSRVIYQKEQNFGMNQLISEAANTYDINQNEVLNKILSGDMPDKFKEEMLPQFKQEVINHLNRLVQFFYTSTSYHHIDRIWLAGGGANLPDIKEDIKTATNMPTEIANPLKYIKKANNVDNTYIEQFGATFMTAFGLASRIDDESREF